MQTEWIWEAKANQAILTEKRSQKVWLKQDLLNRKHVYALLQRSRDIFFSLLAIIVLSPLMLLTALLIVLDFRGVVAYFVKVRSRFLKGRLFEIVIEEENIILHSTSPLILRCLREEGVFQEESRKSLIDEYVNHRY